MNLTMVNIGMEETSTSAPQNEQNNNDGTNGAAKGQQQSEKAPKVQYSIPGVLHFIQHEWARFEMERAQWEVERAELQARIAFLQGERKGQENLKNDLVRRIKMLEYALKQERGKCHKLKYGTDLDKGDLNADDIVDDQIVPMDIDAVTQPNSNASWRQGRQLLRQYLQEIGYADTILDVRSFRVRSLLGINVGEEDLDAPDAAGQFLSRQEVGGRFNKVVPNSLIDAALRESEDSVNATKEFLMSNKPIPNRQDREDDSGDDDEPNLTVIGGGKKPAKGKTPAAATEPTSAEIDGAFDFLNEDSAGMSGAERQAGDGTEEWGVDYKKISQLKEQYKQEAKSKKGSKTSMNRADIQSMLDTLGGENLGDDSNSKRLHTGSKKDENEENQADIDMGELAHIGNMNELDPMTYDVTSGSTKDSFRKTWENRFNLRSHFDCVRAMGFHPVEAVLLTASEDCTMKLWNLQKSMPITKKGAANDLEPVYTFRGHTKPIVCLCMNSTGDACFTGSIDSTVRCWSIPSPNIDPYDNYDCQVLTETLRGHTDAVWSVAYLTSDNRLLSASADGLVKLWEPGTTTPFLRNFQPETNEGNPTSVDFVSTDPQQFMAAYASSGAFLFDLETGKPVLSFESKEHHSAHSKGQINQILSHPTLPITITAHEDRFIRFFDNSTGKLIDCIPAHLDSVTCLSVDPNGLYLLSGSHDCSIRLWDIEHGKQCIQEITAHRKKFDESVFAVAFHPSAALLASAGADGIAKVFI